MLVRVSYIFLLLFFPGCVVLLYGKAQQRKMNRDGAIKSDSSNNNNS